MNLQEILTQKSYWYQDNQNYIIDTDWINQYRQSSPYHNFKWWDEYKFRTPRLYFEIVLKERTEEHIKNTKHEHNAYKSKYVVTISGAISDIPLPIEIWEYHGDPWHGGSIYGDCFYFGRKYKHLEEEYIGKKLGTSSTLIKGFNDLNEAKEFVKMWKIKAINDHKKIIEEDKEIMEIIKEQNGFI